ncbi:MAG TPA: hypothetical protein VJR05_06435 [Acidimicrobiia bacterium]|nr:hypothetical protein [Acidimicrobiia bacterium]
MRTVACAVCSHFITAALLTGRELAGPVRHHQSGCLRCQAHAASLRSSRRLMAGLSEPLHPPPRGLRQQVMGTLEGDPKLPPDSHWWPAAATTGAAVVVLMAWRWRSLRSTAHG